MQISLTLWYRRDPSFLTSLGSLLSISPRSRPYASSVNSFYTSLGTSLGISLLALLLLTQLFILSFTSPLTSPVSNVPKIYATTNKGLTTFPSCISPIARPRSSNGYVFSNRSNGNRPLFHNLINSGTITRLTESP